MYLDEVEADELTAEPLLAPFEILWAVLRRPAQQVDQRRRALRLGEQLRTDHRSTCARHVDAHGGDGPVEREARGGLRLDGDIDVDAHRTGRCLARGQQLVEPVDDFHRRPVEPRAEAVGEDHVRVPPLDDQDLEEIALAHPRRRSGRCSRRRCRARR